MNFLDRSILVLFEQETKTVDTHKEYVMKICAQSAQQLRSCSHKKFEFNPCIGLGVVPCTTGGSIKTQSFEVNFLDLQNYSQ